MEWKDCCNFILMVGHPANLVPSFPLSYRRCCAGVSLRNERSRPSRASMEMAGFNPGCCIFLENPSQGRDAWSYGTFTDNAPLNECPSFPWPSSIPRTKNLQICATFPGT